MKIRKVAAVVVVNKEGKILITKRAEGRIYSGYWDLPAGGVNEGETLEEGAKRETKEEVGFDLTNLKKGVTVPLKTDDLIQEITFYMSKVDNPEVLLNDEHTEYKWVLPIEVLDYKFGVAQDAVKNILKDFNLI